MLFNLPECTPVLGLVGKPERDDEPIYNKTSKEKVVSSD
jgi:hypothetical protein